jgi:HlyD family secretion protein
MSANPSSGGTFTVRRDNLTITVTEGGSIRAQKSIDYKCKVKRGYRDSTELAILTIVPAGTYVTQEDVDSNMVLVQLDSSALEERLIQEEAELTSDQENVTSATEARDIQIIQNESDIADGQLKVRFALLDLQKYLGAELAEKLIRDVNEVSNLTEHIAPFLEKVKNDPNLLDGSAAGEELKKLEDAIVMAEGSLKTAEDTLVGTIKLHDANYVSDLDLQRDQLNVTNRKFAKESADVSLALFKEYDFPKNAEQHLSDYIEAGRQLQRIHAECRSRLAQAQVKLSSAQEQLYWQETRVKEIKQNIEYSIIRAEAPGLVIYGTGSRDDYYRSMRSRGYGGMSSGVIAEGEIVSEGQTIISMPDTAAMVAEINVHETEVDKVRPGQPATIVMDAFPDKILQGEVFEVAPLPDSQRSWMNPDLKVYETLVNIDGTHDFLKSRMSCKVQILVEQLDDIIIVPIQVVSNRAGRKVCYVVTSQGHQERVVQTGLFNDTFVEITEGLEVGDQVMLNPPIAFTGPDAFQQQQPIPQAGARAGAGDVNDLETQVGPDRQARGPRTGRSGDEQGTRRDGTPEGGERPQGRQFELTDQMIDGIMSKLAQIDPEKAKELEKLRKSDPEKFKAQLRQSMRNIMMRQGQNEEGG